MNKEPKHFYEFGPYRVDPHQRLLLRDNQPVPLQPKAFETLLVLVKNTETVVLKDDLMKTVWPDTFVEESNLTQNIFVLRKALGETASDRRYIVTMSGRGYRFAEEVRTVSPPEAAATVEAPDRRPASVPVKGTPRVLYLLAGVVIVLAGSYLAWRQFNQHGPAGSGRVMLAVLPFANLTGDPDKEYLADGLTEEMIAQLGRLNPAQLGVIARTSVMPYKQGNKGLDQIGRELAVQYVLEGSIRYTGRSEERRV